MATSIRGRGGRRTAPHVSRQLVDRLEPRKLLDNTFLRDVGGLPRELTAVGPYVYFALDSGVDGRLSYVDLMRYDPQRDKLVKIYKNDGSKFGKVQYYLSEANDKLVIREKLSNASSQYWTVISGETSAQKADASAAVETPALPVQPKAPPSRKLSGVKSMTPLGANRYAFIANDRGKSRVFACDLDGRNVRQLDVPASANFVRFEQVLAVTDQRLLVSYSRSDQRQIVVGTNGTAKGTSELIVTPAKRKAQLIAARSGRALILDNRDLVVSDGTLGGTLQLVNLNGDALYLRTPEFKSAFVNERLIVGSAVEESGDSVDPESIGGYVAPGSSGVIVGGGGSSGVVSIGTGSIAFDFQSNVANDVSDAGIYSVLSAGTWGLTSSGGKRSGSDTPGSSKSFRLIDGTFLEWGGLDLWRDPVMVSGKAIYSGGWDSRDLWSYEPYPYATVRGRLYSDATLPGRPTVGWQGIKVYADLNDDGRWKDGEPIERTDAQGGFELTLPYLVAPPSGVTVRTYDYSGMMSPSTATSRVSVALGKTTFVDFAVRDVRPERVIRGSVLARVVGSGEQIAPLGARAYVDLNNNGSFDPGEPNTLVTDDYCVIRGAPIGRHRVRLVPTEYQSLDASALAGVEVVTSVANEGSFEFAGNLTYLPPTRIRAAVFLDVNNNGQMDSYEQDMPLARTTFYVDLDDDEFLDDAEPRTQLNANGSVSIKTVANLYSGYYRVRAVLPEGSGYTLASSSTLIALDRTTRTIRFPVRVPDGRVNGIAFVDMDSNGLNTAADLAIDNAQIWADLDRDGVCDNNEETVYIQRPYSPLPPDDRRNQFELQRLPRTKVLLQMRFVGSARESIVSTEVDLSRSASVSGVQIFVRPAKVRIGLFVDRNRDGKRQGAEQPVQGIRLMATDAINHRWARNTASNGTVTFGTFVTSSNIAIYAGRDELQLDYVDVDLARAGLVQWVPIWESDLPFYT